ncbi:MAG: hypothetical protein AB7O52_07630 [Planctomycetota bacterium]
MPFVRTVGAVLLGALALGLFLVAYREFTRPAALPTAREVYRHVDAQPLGLEEPAVVVSAESSPHLALTLRDARGVAVIISANTLDSTRPHLRISRLPAPNVPAAQAESRDLAPGSREEEACFGLLIRLQEQLEATLSYPELDQLVRALESTYWRHVLRDYYRESDDRANVSELQLSEPIEVVQVTAAGATYAVTLLDQANATLDVCVDFGEQPAAVYLGTLTPDRSSGWVTNLASGEAAALYGVLIRWYQRSPTRTGAELLDRLDLVFAERHQVAH